MGVKRIFAESESSRKRENDFQQSLGRNENSTEATSHGQGTRTQNSCGQRLLLEVETINYVINSCIALGERREFEAGFHQSQEGRKLVLRVADDFANGEMMSRGTRGPRPN
jgi:hypothetical protein